MSSNIEYELKSCFSKLDKIVLYEYVDSKRVSKLLKSPYLKITEKKNDEEMLKKYKKKIVNGKVKVQYKKTGSVGRVYPKGMLSSIGFRKVIRHTLSYDKYTDIDIVNCHPSMLYQITQQEGLKNDCLEKYVNDREYYLNEVMNITKWDRECVKELFIEIMNGCNPKNKCDIKLPQFVYDFKDEIRKISNHIYNSNKEFVKSVPKDKKNKKNSVLSYYLQEHENRILEVVYDYMVDNGYIKNNIASLCYDGIMILKIDNVDDLCIQLNKVVLEKTGFDLQFKEKEMDLFKQDIVDSANNDDVIDIDENDVYNMTRYILDLSIKNKYIKDNIRILKPSKLSPIVYEPYKEFADFINDVFTDDTPYYKVFRKSPNNFKQIQDYLEKFNDKELPFVKYNQHIISFKNGYLDIKDPYDITFNSFDDIEYINDIITSVHHDIDFDIKLLDMDVDDVKTPLFDKICNYHFEDEEILKIFYGMCGRLHYPLFDNFNCMLFVKGGANTGKSTTGNIVMRNHQNIGTISGSMEKTFGFQSLHKKSIIYVPDMNKNITEKIDKGDFQRLIEGSRMNIAIKNKGSLNNIIMKTSLFFLSNYFIHYKDSSGAIPRRLCVFFMDRFLEVRDTTLEKRCIEQESHLILIKTIKSYVYLLDRFKGKTFEDWGIEYFKRGYEEMTNKCNKLYEFLTLPPGDYDYHCVYKKGHITKQEDLKKCVERFYYMNGIKEKFELNKTTLGRCGYEIKQINLCASCGKKAFSKKNEKCCDNYNSKNRRKKYCIVNLKIVRKEIEEIIEKI